MSEMDGAPTRGSREAYERYLRGMDASMRQKVALTAAHLLCTGKVADMGMGSGAGSEALAALYPMLDVVGVDLDPTMVEMASAKFRRKNLSFVQGDIAEPILPAESMDGIFDSSVLHHVTSFGGYERARAGRALENQVRALKPHGILVVRDFLAPPETDGVSPEVLLDLPSDDGDASDDPRTCSTAGLFVRFATREYRSLHATPGFPYREEPAPGPGRRRFRLTLRMATEFVLRKDYRADWESEAKEEYAYYTQEEFLRLFARLGLRVLASTPIRNPWIVRNRFAGKIALTGADGAAVRFPATNVLVAGEKVGPGEGVAFRELSAAVRPGFLVLDHYEDTRAAGRFRDLARRPHASVDVVPFFEHEGDLFVVARMSYPRPVLGASVRSPSLDESTPPGYVTEPLTTLLTDKPLGQTVEEMLAALANVGEAQVRAIAPASTYYPSPGGSQEEVRSVLVEVDPLFVDESIANVSGFSTSGRVRAIEAEQVLRAAQVGGMPDARLELAVYDLFVRRGRAPGPWIGETPALGDAAVARGRSAEALDGRAPRRAFRRRGAASAGFLHVVASRFEEVDAAGRVLGHVDLEYVVPKTLGTNTLVCALLARIDGEPCLGVEDDDLPAAQAFEGSSALLVTPAWRLPRAVTTTDAALAWVRPRLEADLGLRPGAEWELGGAYHPSAGMSPEVCTPVAFEVTGAASNRLDFVPLRSLVQRLDRLRDGHLRLVALRAAHALGVLGP